MHEFSYQAFCGHAYCVHSTAGLGWLVDLLWCLQQWKCAQVPTVEFRLVRVAMASSCPYSGAQISSNGQQLSLSPVLESAETFKRELS